MDNKIEILLGSVENIASVNVDTHEKIELTNKPNGILEYDIRNVLSATEIFDTERAENPVYRIYGKIEYMSILNGLKNDYTVFEDFFKPQTIDSKNILDSFDFYLVKPAESGYTHVVSGGSSILWTRYFTVIANPSNFELFPIGFANNVYGEQGYAFNFNEDFDVSGYFDEFGFPATELFLYAQYKKSPLETTSMTSWDEFGNVTNLPYIITDLNIGDYVKTSIDTKIGDMVEYSKTEFYQAQLSPQTFYIETPYGTESLVWKYNPFIPLRLRYFGDELNEANISGTSYERTSSIPNYATLITGGTGNYVWRDILPQGYTDPITDVGVDYPFVNKKRYLFSNIILSIIPDLTDVPTRNAFEEVWFSMNASKINTTLNSDINTIGDPC